MIECTFILAPLLVLPLIVLFRFIGCGPEQALDNEPIVEQVPPPPGYREYILGESIYGNVRHSGVKPDGAAVKGYWRLIDKDQSKGAKDEKGKYPGVYQSTASTGAAPGVVDSSLREDLLKSDPTAESQLFNGGFVSIADTGGFYAQEFTIEAWIQPGDALLNGPEGVEHILFQAGGHFVRFPESTEGDHGFQILAIGHKWQVKFAPFVETILSKPPGIPLGTSHLAVTFKHESVSVKAEVSVFVNGIKMPVEAILKYFSPPDGAPLFIGAGVPVGKWRDFDKDKAHHPFRGYIQEVVIHHKVLPQPEIDNHYGIGKGS